MSIAANSPIPFRLFVCPQGIIRRVGVQQHALPNFLVRDRRGQVQLDAGAASKGWADVFQLYDEETSAAEKAGDAPRVAELTEGRKKLVEYLKAVGAGEVLAYQLNPGAQPKDVEVFPDWALPKSIPARRKRAAEAVHRLTPPTRPVVEVPKKAASK